MVDVYRPRQPTAFRARYGQTVREALKAHARTRQLASMTGLSISCRGSGRLNLSTTVGSLGLVTAD
eukprot:1545398-Alexandrium_andersonii.AAC.1